MKMLLPILALSSCVISLSACSPAAQMVSTDVATNTGVKRIKQVQVIEHVTCDPKRAKEIQKEIDQRAKKRAQQA